MKNAIRDDILTMLQMKNDEMHKKTNASQNTLNLCTTYH